MFDQVQLIFFNLLQYKRALQKEAREFASWRHNADLCPSVQGQCEAILTIVERYRSVVYDTQGPGDAGTDVLVALNYKDETRYIGFQIKSDIEVSKDTLRTLKAQWVDAQNRFDERLLDYYILLAWDPKVRVQAIRSVSQTFSTTRRVHVIEPAYLWTFLNGLSRFQMQALITAYLSDDDPLILRAKMAVADCSPTQLALLTVFLEAHTNPESPPMTADHLHDNSYLRQMYRQSSGARLYGMDLRAGIDLPPWLEQAATEDENLWARLAEDLDTLEPWVYQADDGRYELEVIESMTLLSLAYEGRARYGHTRDELSRYLYQLLRTPSESARDPWADAVDVFLGVFDSQLPDAKLAPALAELLQLNCPQLADEVQPPEGGRMMDWDHLARELLRRAWEDETVQEEQAGLMDEDDASRLLKHALAVESQAPRVQPGSRQTR
jgi:hypothetical protein